MEYRVSTTRISKASREAVWKALEDMESWPKWGDETRKTHMISHKILSRDGNIAICEEDEVAGGFRAKHKDRYVFYPKDKLEEEIIEGPVSGGFSLKLTDVSEGGTRLDWSFWLSPKILKYKIVGLFNGKNVVQGICDEYCRQLAEYAEAHP
jgi:hypothetical protein